MVRIWLPPDTHQRLLEGVPGWSRAHKVLSDAAETHYAAGVRRISCDLHDALALLQAAERVYPEAAPLIRIAIRKVPTAPSVHTDVPRQHDELIDDRDLRPQGVPLRVLASLQILAFSLQTLPFLDRVRELVRRFL
jgi:hypothetical protein